MEGPSVLSAPVPRIQRYGSLLKAVQKEEERARDQYSLNFNLEPSQGSQSFLAGINHAGVLCSGPIPCSSAPGTGVKKYSMPRLFHLWKGEKVSSPFSAGLGMEDISHPSSHL